MTTSLLAAVAAHRLAGAQLDPAELPLRDGAWQRFSAQASAHGLSGLLADATARGGVASTDAQRESAHDAHANAMAGCLALESLLVAVGGALADEGVEARILNGTAAAHLDYPDPALRPFADLDLLIADADLDTGRAALASLGLRATRPNAPRRWVDEAGRQVELHAHAVPARWVDRVSVADLWAETGSIMLAARRFPVLSEEHRLVAACLKAAEVGESRMITVRDVVQQVLAGRVRQDAVDEIARRWDATAAVAASIAGAWSRFALADVVALSVWAARHRQGSGEPRAGRVAPRSRTHRFDRRWLVRR